MTIAIPSPAQNDNAGVRAFYKELDHAKEVTDAAALRRDLSADYYDEVPGFGRQYFWKRPLTKNTGMLVVENTNIKSVQFGKDGALVRAIRRQSLRPVNGKSGGFETVVPITEHLTHRGGRWVLDWTKQDKLASFGRVKIKSVVGKPKG